MSTDSEQTAPQVEIVDAQEFPDVLGVIEGTLDVDTDDDQVGQNIWIGFTYLLRAEFLRQQPSLALLYEMEIQLLAVRPGSRKYDFKIWVRLKRAIKKWGGAAGLSAALAIAPAADATIHVWEHFFPPVQTQLHACEPSKPVVIVIKDIRQPDGRDIFSKDQKEFNF